MTSEILIFVFALGILCLSWPLLEIFRPELVVYLFVFWFVYIITVAFIDYRVNHHKKR